MSSLATLNVCGSKPLIKRRELEKEHRESSRALRVVGPQVAREYRLRLRLRLVSDIAAAASLPT